MNDFEIGLSKIKPPKKMFFENYMEGDSDGVNQYQSEERSVDSFLRDLLEASTKSRMYS